MMDQDRDRGSRIGERVADLAGPPPQENACYVSSVGGMPVRGRRKKIKRVVLCNFRAVYAESSVRHMLSVSHGCHAPGADTIQRSVRRQYPAQICFKRGGTEQNACPGCYFDMAFPGLRAGLMILGSCVDIELGSEPGCFPQSRRITPNSVVVVEYFPFERGRRIPE